MRYKETVVERFKYYVEKSRIDYKKSSTFTKNVRILDFFLAVC